MVYGMAVATWYMVLVLYIEVGRLLLEHSTSIVMVVMGVVVVVGT